MQTFTTTPVVCGEMYVVLKQVAFLCVCMSVCECVFECGCVVIIKFLVLKAYLVFEWVVPRGTACVRRIVS